MNKIVPKLTIFVLLIGLTSCSYSPIFSEKNYNFEIDNIILIGEKEINNVIGIKDQKSFRLFKIPKLIKIIDKYEK